MKIIKSPPLNVVTREQYERDKIKRADLSQLEQDLKKYDDHGEREQYTMRAITDQSSNDSYGADFLVVVNEIVRPRKTLFNWLASQVIKISLSPIDLDDGSVIDQEDTQPIGEDGITYARAYSFLRFIHLETGYLMKPADNMDTELAEILDVPAEQPKIPCGVRE